MRIVKKKKNDQHPAKRIEQRRNYISTLLRVGVSIEKETILQKLADQFGCTKNTIKNDIILQRAEFDEEALQVIVTRKWNGCNRRARQLGVPNHLNFKKLLSLYKASNGECFYCGKKINKAQLIIDHVVPMSKGGSNTFENIVLSCWFCNLKKGDRIIDDEAM